tara:strand:- start:226 stop:1026 length:801 start_codon:yes stop_codon:yes gene_type:complete
MKRAIHTVFIMKENILFLEEWINYHMLLGFNKFYLYDNSKVQKTGGCHPRHKCFTPQKVNKYNVNYDELVKMDNKEMQTYIQQLCNKYKCVKIIEWSPKKNGIVLHNQKEAHNHCLKLLKKDRIDWCANIDMDEYIVLKDHSNINDYINRLPSNIKNIRLGQVRFDSRFNNLDKLVTDITKSELDKLPRGHSNKNIYNVNSTKLLDIHKWHPTNTVYKEIVPKTDIIWFNHYKMNQKEYNIVDNIHHDIKDKIRRYSVDYIPINKL